MRDRAVLAKQVKITMRLGAFLPSLIKVYFNRKGSLNKK